MSAELWVLSSKVNLEAAQYSALSTSLLFTHYSSLITHHSCLCSPCPIIACQLHRRLAHLFGNRIGDIHTINYANHRGLDCYLLITHRRACCFSKSTNHHLAAAGAQSIRDDNNVTSGFLFEIVRVHDQKANAFQIRRFLGRPDCADDFSQKHSFKFQVSSFEFVSNVKLETRNLKLP